MSKKMRPWKLAVAVVVLSSTVSMALSKRARAEAAKKSAAELEKEKALQNPYPNDLGPDEIDDVAKTYPGDIQEGYKLLKVRCAQCHQPARPLNSRFVEVGGASEDARKAAVAALKKDHPEFFNNPAVWQVEWDTWQRYVKRMMSKPGCVIAKDEGKKIWKFLVYDSGKRKLGENAKKWEEHRKKLVEEFKAKYPKRYEELAKDQDL